MHSDSELQRAHRVDELLATLFECVLATACSCHTSTAAARFVCMLIIDGVPVRTGVDPSSEQPPCTTVPHSHRSCKNSGDIQPCETGAQRWGLHDALQTWMSADQRVPVERPSQPHWDTPGSQAQISELTFCVGNMEQVQ